MKIRLMAVTLLVAAVTACGGGDGVTVQPDSPSSPTVRPGDSLTLLSTETVAIDGLYFLPKDAMFLRTRCFGQVAVTYETSTGSQMTNTCHSQGNSSQLNVVLGVDYVLYEFGADAYARVTVD